MESSLRSPQKFLGKKGLILLIFLINMTAPMSTDMYLSAFPSMVEAFQTTTVMLNYTLVGFFISFAIGMLTIGPLSDKVGRKPILITGIFVYGLFSHLCSISSTVEQLIFNRIAQALGAGGMVAVSTAMVKDVFSDEERPKIIALLQMLGAFAPTVAPLLGAQIIQYFSWNATFETLTILSCVSLILSIMLSETLAKSQRIQGNVFQTLLSLGQIVKLKPFMVFLLTMTGPTLIYMSFLAVSSYIYIKWFHLSQTHYSIFFAINSLILMVGPQLYLLLRNKLSARQIVRVSFMTILIAGISLLSIGSISSIVFLISFMPVTIGTSFL
jgi:DHA1 family bicyclomycin/chloramphenicol resistance-like MFS transporter